MSIQPTVLYEDSRGGDTRFFGPHDFLCACISDRTGKSVFELRRNLVSNPRRGVVELLRTASRVAPLFAGAPRLLMVLVDNDRIREHLKMRHDACRTEVVAAIRERHGFVVVLLEDNTETLLGVVAEILGQAPIDRKPNPLERDQRLQSAAFRATPEQREAILGRIPSFRRLVEAAILALAP